MCVVCLRAGSQLEPKLTHEQLVNIAGNCLDLRHRWSRPNDNLLPHAETVPSRGRMAAHAAVVVVGLVLAGGAAYGVAPGELGHHGAEVVGPPASQPAGGHFQLGTSIEAGTPDK